MKIWTTVEEVLADFEADRPKPPPKPEPTVLKVASDRKLSVEGQRERVMNEVKQLAETEREEATKVFAPTPAQLQREEAIRRKKKAIDPNDYRVKRERDRQTGLYYRQLYETVAWSEHNAKQRAQLEADHNNYNPVALFERQIRNEIDG